jgi:transposase
MRKYHHKISKVTINVIRGLYLKGEVNQRAAGRLLKISPNTVANYLKQFRIMEELYPGKIRSNRFFLPCEIKLPAPSEKKHNILHLLPTLVSTDQNKRLVSVNLWKRYRLIRPESYSQSCFNHIYQKWKLANNINIFSTSKVQILTDDDLKILDNWRHDKIRRNWEKAVVIKGSFDGESPYVLADRTGRTIEVVEEWIAIFKKEGIKGITHKENYNKAEVDAAVAAKVDKVIQILHQKPQIFGINRTSWSLETLAATYVQVHKEKMSRGTVSAYLRGQGFSFRKAREVLTSPDPNFKKKLDKVIAIVANLGSNDRFFSIDEMGPFAIKMRGGRSMMTSADRKTIPAWQKPKGYLICTAALELSTNQVTHFYSPNKTTSEMIKLLDLLLIQYKSAEKIYLSWDAASWHNSHMLKDHIRDVNSQDYRDTHHTPFVALAPLPISSQFLNVIESVFAGLAKSVLHNSDYASTDDCKLAIDRYFLERNLHFIKNPRKAGGKIWGKEIVKPAFYEGHNCKDPRVRQ